MKSNKLKESLIRLQITLVVIVLLITWIFVSLNDFHVFKKISIQNYETMTKILARNLSACISFSDKDECNRVLDTISNEKNVIEAVVVDTSGTPLASYKRPSSDKIDYSFKFHKDQFEYFIADDKIRTTFPIYDEKINQGRIFIVADFNLFNLFGKRHTLIFLLAVIGCSIIGMVLSRHFRKKIVIQITLLLKTILRIKHEKSYHLRMKHDPFWEEIKIEEFKQLGEAFDDMIEQIENRDKFLKDQNEGLENLVQLKAKELARTAELASLGEMAGGIAHEINNPLTIIKSSTKVLKLMVEKDKYEKDFFKEYLGMIDNTVDRIATIISGLRNLSRSSEDDKRVQCNLASVLNDVLGVALARFATHGIEFRKNYNEEDLTVSFNTNRIQLSQVMVNLLNNAYDAVMSYQEKWIEIAIDKNFEKDWLKITITDSGKGIPIEVRDKIFNPFFTTKEIGKGTGIGLSISKSIIEKGGGKFYYDENTKNTAFVILISTKS